jgi:hypothetical protein
VVELEVAQVDVDDKERGVDAPHQWIKKETQKCLALTGTQDVSFGK